MVIGRGLRNWADETRLVGVEIGMFRWKDSVGRTNDRADFGHDGDMSWRLIRRFRSGDAMSL